MTAVITWVLGGLGNQMFQYAAGLSSSLTARLPLRLDLRGFRGYDLHQGFSLARTFGIESPAATLGDVASVVGPLLAPYRLTQLARHPRLAGLRGSSLAVEDPYALPRPASPGPGGAYLAGYWQSEGFFTPWADRVRGAFAFPDFVDGRNLETLDRLGAKPSVALHVRRGDYVSNPRAHQFHGVLAADYYTRAIGYLRERMEDLQFVVFSDEPAWARQNVAPAGSVVVDWNRGDQSYRDMQLMSRCRHHIIANSSMSWWGAWLSSPEGRIVVAPSVWFKGEPKRGLHIVPPSWTRL